MQKKARDVVVVRVSEQGDRDEESFHSPQGPAREGQAVERGPGQPCCRCV